MIRTYLTVTPFAIKKLFPFTLADVCLIAALKSVESEAVTKCDNLYSTLSESDNVNNVNRDGGSSDIITESILTAINANVYGRFITRVIKLTDGNYRIEIDAKRDLLNHVPSRFLSDKTLISRYLKEISSVCLGGNIAHNLFEYIVYRDIDIDTDVLSLCQVG